MLSFGKTDGLTQYPLWKETVVVCGGYGFFGGTVLIRPQTCYIIIQPNLACRLPGLHINLAPAHQTYCRDLLAKLVFFDSITPI